jgi:hypothetical protein
MLRVVLISVAIGYVAMTAAACVDPPAALEVGQIEVPIVAPGANGVSSRLARSYLVDHV